MAIGSVIVSKDLVYLDIRMAVGMKGNGWKINKMDLVLDIRKMVWLNKEFGLIDN